MIDLTLEELERLARSPIPGLGKTKDAAPQRPEVRSHPFIARVILVNRVTCDCGAVFECPRTTRPLLKRRALGSHHAAWELLPDTGGLVDLPLEVRIDDMRVSCCQVCGTHTAGSRHLPGLEPEKPLGPHEVQTRDYYTQLLGERTRRQAQLDAHDQEEA